MLGVILATVLFVAPEATAVIAVGDDAAKAARLQGALESAAKDPLPAGEVAARVGIPGPAPTPHPDRAKVKELLAQAGAAFYDDRYEALLEALRKAEELDLEPRERVEVSLWRASVVLALGDRTGAAKAVQSALTLDPDLVVDVKVFPPAIRDIAAEEKPKLGAVAVTLPKLPPGVTLTVDGRNVGAKLSLAPGKHVAEVSGSGVRRTHRDFEVTVGKPVTIEVPFAPSLAADVATEIANALVRGDAPSSRFELAKKLDAAVLVFAVVRAEDSRALVWWRDDGRRASSGWRTNDDQGRAAIAAFVEKELAAGAPSKRDRAWRWSTAAYAGGVSRSLAVTSRGTGNSFRGGFGGALFAIEGTAARGPWSFTLGGGGRSYSASKVRTSENTTTVANGNGGDTRMGSLDAAWTMALGVPGESQRFEAILGIGLEYESHHGLDPGGYGFLPEHEWAAALARVGGAARFPLGGGHVRVALRAGAGPGNWRELPSGTFGKAASPSRAIGGDGSATWLGAGTWRAGVRYSFQSRSMSYRGYARTAVDPPIKDARIAETLHGFALFAGKEF